jgi:hypothetical protein
LNHEFSRSEWLYLNVAIITSKWLKKVRIGIVVILPDYVILSEERYPVPGMEGVRKKIWILAANPYRKDEL